LNTWTHGLAANEHLGSRSGCSLQDSQFRRPTLDSINATAVIATGGRRIVVAMRNSTTASLLRVAQ
jgi:hypothetical protein